VTCHFHFGEPELYKPGEGFRRNNRRQIRLPSMNGRSPWDDFISIYKRAIK
jgi:hypothetical protein